MIRATTLLSCCVAVSACGTQSLSPSAAHLKPAPRVADDIPAPLQHSPALRPPKPVVKAETYSVSVYKVPVQTLLFALARDAKLNIDVHPDIDGEVTLNAIDQTLPQILDRISRQIDMRYELHGPNLAVLPDTPFLRNYKVDYVNMSRETTSTVSIATQVSTGTKAAIGGGGDNNSTTSVSNTSNNRFWDVLVRNITDTLRETDKVVPENTGGAEGATGAEGAAGQPARRSSYREAASVIANPETGLIAVRATSRQHEKIQEFLDLVLASAKRQVMIEATVVEVQLSDQYQQGINWSSLRTGVEGASLTQGKVGDTPLPSGISPAISQGLFVLNYINPSTILNSASISATVQLLESFGKVKVLSSPRISVMNNQTALLKVVDNSVYFTLKVTPALRDANGVVTSPALYESTVETVPVGFVMSVTPQISENDEVTIGVRPSISRIIGYEQDPSPGYSTNNVVSRIPIVQTRELESVLKVTNGQIAVMGGLMQDSVDNKKDVVPLVGRIPFVGDAFAYRNEKTTKSELVIFLRPVIVKNASLDGDYKDYRTYLENDGPLNATLYGEDKKKAPPKAPRPPASKGKPSAS